ncbi:MAG: histidine--tRNA ligase, partial [Planctomycetes bacterium]|nr:histidine--tRNA ligase [Planctomycetota bacterium]
IVTLKNLNKGRAGSAKLKERKDWIKERPGQIEVPRSDLVAAVRRMLAESEESP